MLLAPASVVRAEDAHYTFQLTVDPPANTNDPFHIHLAEELVGAKPGQQVSITYELIAVDPDGSSQVLLGLVSESNSFGGGHQSTNYGYWPRQNGQFAFRVVRLDGSQRTVLAEQRLATDQAAQLEPVPPPNTRPDGRFEVTALTVDPPQPGVGQTVTLEVDALNSSRDTVTQAVPVLFVDDSGQQLLATGTFSLAPGTSGSGQVYWIPQHSGSGLLQAGDQSVVVTVLDSPAGVPSPSEEQSVPDESPGD